MNRDFEQIERAVEQELAALTPKLAAPPPSAASVARTKAAVAVECARMQRQRRWLITLRPAVGVAAAVLLIVAFWTPLGGRIRCGDRRSGNYAG